MLISSLSDRDGVVRWSAAKGVARVVTRLPTDFGHEVIGAVLEIFGTDLESDFLAADDASWHGACLALGELIRAQ